MRKRKKKAKHDIIMTVLFFHLKITATWIIWEAKTVFISSKQAFLSVPIRKQNMHIILPFGESKRKWKKHSRAILYKHTHSRALFQHFSRKNIFVSCSPHQQSVRALLSKLSYASGSCLRFRLSSGAIRLRWRADLLCLHTAARRRSTKGEHLVLVLASSVEGSKKTKIQNFISSFNFCFLTKKWNVAEVFAFFLIGGYALKTFMGHTK